MPIPTTFAIQSILAAVPEVAYGLSVPESYISTTNAGVLLSMSVSPLLWIPLLGLLGRRVAYVTAAMSLCADGTLTFGWSLRGDVGGVYLTAVAAFITGIGIMASLNTLGTYTAGG